jgi:Eukaryotic-type carbonic anhydrase
MRTYTQPLQSQRCIAVHHMPHRTSSAHRMLCNPYQLSKQSVSVAIIMINMNGRPRNKRPLLIFLLCALHEQSGVGGVLPPERWAEKYPDCGGKRQSPILLSAQTTSECKTDSSSWYFKSGDCTLGNAKAKGRPSNWVCAIHIAVF